MDTYEVNAVVVGAGVIGLAVARALALEGLEPLVLEKNAVFGEETSARNSEVIHAGIYYPAGSEKARHCVAGKRALYDFCARRGVAHRRVGKLIVATDATEAERLAGIRAAAAANGVGDLVELDADELRRREPALRAVAGLHSPSTGIVDSHGYMQALLGEAEAHGTQLVPHTRVREGRLLSDGRVELAVDGEEPMRLRTPRFINAAGLWAPQVTVGIDGLPAPPSLSLVKGNYFSLAARQPFSTLVYPIPQGGGLGVHYTVDLSGRGRFGPDTEWLDDNDPAHIDYTVADGRQAVFYDAIRRYWPALPDDSLVPDYSGVRPKLEGDEYPDFRIDGPAEHGLAGHVMLYGVESPGLTASLSIADTVASLVKAA